MATQSKFNTVLPSNTIQQGLIYTPISSIYANSINTLGQAENVMTANDVELSLNTTSAGSTASINIPASYKLLGNMYLKLKVKLSTLLMAPKPTDSETYRELYQQFNGNSIIYGNTPNGIDVVQPDPTGGTATEGAQLVTDVVGLGTLNTGLPLDINFLAYNMIKQLTWRIPGCDRLYIQGIRMLPVLLDKCTNEEEKQKLAMLSGTGHHLYSYNMISGTPRTTLVQWKKKSNWIANNPTSSVGDRAYLSEGSPLTPSSVLNIIEDPTFVIYALLDLPWSTIDKDKPGLYYPSHMTTSALELNIQFQDSDYMRVLPEEGYSGYQVDVIAASLRFTYAAVATMTYYKPPIYKLPCSLHYDFEFPATGFDTSPECRINLMGLKNGEITQILMFIHQAPGATANNIGLIDNAYTNSTMRFKWRNEPLKNVQVEYAGQIIWKGTEDGYDFMNQFDNRKSWSAFKLPALLTTKMVNPIANLTTLGNAPIFQGNGMTPQPPGYPAGYVINKYLAGQGDYGVQGAPGKTWSYMATNDFATSYCTGNNDATYAADGVNHNMWPFSAANTIALNDLIRGSTGIQGYKKVARAALSNGYDVSSTPMLGLGPVNDYFNQKMNDAGTAVVNISAAVPENLKWLGQDAAQKAMFDGPFLPSAGILPFTKITRWHTPNWPVTYNRFTWQVNNDQINDIMIANNTSYHYSDCFHWTTIPVAEKIDQIRGPRDYALGADFKDSNLIVRFDGYDALRSSASNSFVATMAAKIRWNLHVVVSITSAFIFNGDKADLMQ